MSSYEDEAQRRFGTSFNSLSEWARRAILRDLSSSSFGPKELDLTKYAAVLQEKINKLELENKDLWEENEDLKLENLELTDELAKNSSGRNTRHTQVRNSASS